jgi:S-adenosylmethionine-diacylglycerol 3-amino-3-carboxypropyl transferase
VGYAQCWEDPRLLIEALEPAPGKRILSIASAGDNSFALALAGAEVDAIDLSAPQLALCELKLAGGALSYGAYRELLGLTPGDPLARYRELRDDLSPMARAWWEEHPDMLRAGVLDQGRFERYLAIFRERLLPLMHRRSTVHAWFDLPDVPSQRRYYRDVWDGRRWRGLFKLFFSRRVMAWRGRSPEQFAHVEGEVSAVFLRRAQRVLTELPLRDNGYVQWMLTGAYVDPSALPAYLTPEGHARLGEIRQRIRLIHAPLEVHLGGAVGPYHGFNLSDVFEYLSPEQSEALYRQIVARSAPGARVAYWNLLVPRERPVGLASRVVPEHALGAALHARDRAFVYGAFRVEVVR